MQKIFSILIVDDSDEDRYLLKRALKKCGLTTAIAETRHGEEAIEFLTQFDEVRDQYPDLSAPLIVFLDINMPVMNGWQFLVEFQRCRNKIEFKPTVIVMYSTSDQSEDRSRVDDFDCVSQYVVKGEYTPEQIRDTLLECVG